MGAVLADAEALERADLILLRFGGDGPEEGDVIVGVEAAEVAVAGRVRAEHLHLVEEAVAAEQRVGHADAVRLHRVAMLVVAVAHLRVVEVADAALRPVRASGRQGVAAAAQHGKGCVSQGASTNFASINCSAQSIRVGRNGVLRLALSVSSLRWTSTARSSFSLISLPLRVPANRST
ncbi:hypothetical protein ZEAMMB73_Zm00001d018345 [Zea mays]|uniref:Uncharacterized protein n=1 Tax=Zea mays TaxID=4577 RepID=A0A1D6HMY0_MAIZE|nr:hypothetical protein ZEAMMB73_Zm00001d018345 [Zea mays]